MKIFIRLFFIYLFFLIQIAIRYPPLDLLVLILVIFALHDPTRDALILGTVAGFLMSLANPLNFAIPIFIYATIGFITSITRRFIYKERIYFLLILLISLIFKYLISLLFFKTTPRLTTWLLQTTLILVLAIPLEIFFSKIFYHQWRMHIAEDNY